MVVYVYFLPWKVTSLVTVESWKFFVQKWPSQPLPFELCMSTYPKRRPLFSRHFFLESLNIKCKLSCPEFIRLLAASLPSTFWIYYHLPAYPTLHFGKCTDFSASTEITGIELTPRGKLGKCAANTCRIKTIFIKNIPGGPGKSENERWGFVEHPIHVWDETD